MPFHSCALRILSKFMRSRAARRAIPTTLLAALAIALPEVAVARETDLRTLTDEALVLSLPGGFENAYSTVNGVRLHYVEGGSGPPLFLLPGWPETWWEFHKVMPDLAMHYRVIAVDLRGMGGSDRPVTGYDKKTMAADIHALAAHLGFKKINIAGHDIGAMVAYSHAANFPEATQKIALIDVAHPDAGWYDMPLLPRGQKVGGTGEETQPVYLWWFAFNQIDGLPGRLWADRPRLIIDWLFDTQLKNKSAIDERDRSIYARAYSTPDSIRAGNAWYQTFMQDIDDEKTYGKVVAPLLALVGGRNFPYLSTHLPEKGVDVRVELIGNSSHYVPEEQPDEVVQRLVNFFQ